MKTIERKVMTRKIARNAVKKGIISDHTELFPIGGFNNDPNGISQHKKAIAKKHKRIEREIGVGFLKKLSKVVNTVFGKFPSGARRS